MRQSPTQVQLNERYNRLVVIEHRGQDRHGRNMWLCRCDCGKETIVATTSLRTGASRSCGCLQREAARRSATHGMHNSAEYRAWVHMKERCLNPKTKHFHRYGGRGITLAHEWLDFSTFLTDMGRRPEGCWLERVNNDGPYSKENCLWATTSEQARNRSSNIKLTYNKRTQIVSDWARETGLAATTICRRLFRLGWTVRQALETPPYKRRCA